MGPQETADREHNLNKNRHDRLEWNIRERTVFKREAVRNTNLRRQNYHGNRRKIYCRVLLGQSPIAKLLEYVCEKRVFLHAGVRKIVFLHALKKSGA